MEKRISTIYDYVRFTDTVCGESCVFCPASSFKNGFGCGCTELLKKHTDKYNEILLEWIDCHPVKTYRDDFFEKFPNAMRDKKGLPDACVNHIYGNKFPCDSKCYECWKQPYEESEEIK